MTDLKNLSILITELNESNSTNDKKAVLAKHPECKNILYWIYHPLIQYYVSPANIQKQKISEHPDAVDFADIYDMLEKLSKRQITGHAAIVSVKNFIKQYQEDEDLIFRILDKDIKARIDVKIINAVYPGFIPTFNVALASDYQDFSHKVDYATSAWYASRKLDGVRVIAIIDKNGGIRFFSREGNEFLTLDVVKEELLKLKLPNNTVLDGECCIIDENGLEDFKAIVKLIRKKDFTIPNPRYKLFDFIPLETFEKTKGGPELSLRYKQLERVVPTDNPVLTIIEQRWIKSEEELVSYMDEAIAKGWEGLILRKSMNYEGKRSRFMLKVKKFVDAEFVVKGVVNGPIRFIEAGKEKEEEMLSAVQIEYKGNIVGVGSGFTMEQRRDFFKNPQKIIGKEITVKYFGESQNDKGEYSLRFPTLKHIWENGRNV